MAWRVRTAPDLGGVPSEEGISTADAAQRIELDPETQPNRGERSESAPGGIAGQTHPEDS